MTVYEVRQGAGGAGSSLPTIGAAARLVRPGDEVVVFGGVYRERLVADVAGVTWRAAAGETVVIDGGWKVGDGVGDGQGGPPLVSVVAEDVTLDGLVVRNSPGDNVVVGGGGHNALLRGLRVDHSYSGGIIVNGGTEYVRRVRIDGCTITRAGMSWEAGWRKNVSGSVNFVRAEDSSIADSVIAYGYGEGVNFGKGSRRLKGERVTSFDNAHLCFYFNRCTDSEFVECVAFLTGFQPRLVGKDTWPAGFVFGDEVSERANKFPHSRGNRIRRCVVVNAGTLISVRNNERADGYDTCLDAGTVIENCTLVAGPQTRRGLDIKENLAGRPHEAACIRGNAIHLNYAMPGADIATSSSRAIYWHRNAWSQMPPALCRSDGDVVGFALRNPGAALANEFPEARHDLALGNYTPPVRSPLIGAGPNGTTIGALEEREEPDEPPDEPPVEPEWRLGLEEAERVLVANCELYAATLPEWVPGVVGLRVMAKMARWLDGSGS